MCFVVSSDLGRSFYYLNHLHIYHEIQINNHIMSASARAFCYVQCRASKYCGKKRIFAKAR